jgi:hypothetical protein
MRGALGLALFDYSLSPIPTVRTVAHRYSSTQVKQCAVQVLGCRQTCAASTLVLVKQVKQVLALASPRSTCAASTLVLVKQVKQVLVLASPRSTCAASTLVLVKQVKQVLVLASPRSMGRGFPTDDHLLMRAGTCHQICEL